MISQVLLARLKERFPERIDASSELPPNPHGPPPVAWFPATSSDFGDVEVYDHVDEVTILLGNFTHIHIGCYKEHLSFVEKEEMIVTDTVDFLSRLFADEIECMSRWWGGSCGPRGSFKGEVFVWSGRVRSQ